MDRGDLSKILGARAKRCISLANGLLDSSHYILAGSCIATSEIRDIDIYPVAGCEFTIPRDKHLVATKNSVTIQNTPPLQFCNFEKPNLEALLDSFDFAHIQAGVRIGDGAIVEIKWTESFLYAGACLSSCFTGSEYPLSSLIRLLKYHKRGEISNQSAMVSSIEILSAIVSRGFNSYEDFKDQLDAVDLGLIPENQQELIEPLQDLYSLLNKGAK
jgi:hypothetical protein